MSDDEKKSGIASKALAMSAGVALSRITGLLREQSFAYLFGASPATQAFVAAFRIPNFFRDLLAENIASAAIQPTFIGIREKEGKEAASRFASATLALILSVAFVITTVGILFAAPISNLIAPGFADEPGKIELMTLLAKWLFPFLILIAVAAYFQSIQNADGKFFLPALSTAGLNIGFIAAGWYFSGVLDPPILGMAWGALIGGVVAIVLLAPGYRRATGSLRLASFAGRDDIKSMLMLAAPVVLGVAATNINVLVNTFAASYAEDGAMAWLNYAYRVMHLPLGLVAVSLGSAALPALSKSFAANDDVQFCRTLKEALTHAIRISLPASIGIIFFHEEIVSLIYGYGRFSADDVHHTALALGAYSVGIPAFTINRILAPAFYARKDTRTPMSAGLVSVATNMILNGMAIMMGYGYLGIAIAASAAGYVQTILLFAKLRKTTFTLN